MTRGTNFVLKDAAPTEIFSPVKASRASGYSVPTNTVAQAVVRNKLLRMRAPSREIGANNPPCLGSGARQADNAKLPAMDITRMARVDTARDGCVAKAW